ncbi:MAG: hypothetical protein KAT28_00630 [Candidatus Aenigmarchaeota archaeon]|nr:hypothetical protein [Candidatus Aenigmarchaeota archaeon]
MESSFCRLLCISDVKTFVDCEKLIDEIKPNYILFLGDILRQGCQRFPITPKQKKEIEKELQGYTFEQDFNIPKIVKKHGDFIIQAYYDSCEAIKILFQNIFIKFVKHCLDKKEIKRIVFIRGNNDADINYNDLVQKVLGDNEKIITTQTFKLGNYKCSSLDYDQIHFKKKLKKVMPLIEESSIIFTHASTLDIKDFLNRTKRRPNMIITGHSGTEWLKIQDTFIIRIDNFPYSFSLIDISNGLKVYFGSYSSFSGKLKTRKILEQLNETIPWKLEYQPWKEE